MFEGLAETFNFNRLLCFSELLQKPAEMESKTGGKRKRAGGGKKVPKMEKAFPNLFHRRTSGECFLPPLMNGQSKLASKQISIIKEAAIRQALERSGTFDFAEPAIGEGIYRAKQLHILDCPEGSIQFGMTLVDRIRNGAHSSVGPFYLLFQVSSYLPQAPQIIPEKFYVCGFVQNNCGWEVITDPKKILFQGNVKIESLPTDDPSHTLSDSTESDARTPPDCKDESCDLFQESENNKYAFTGGVLISKTKVEKMEEEPCKMEEDVTTTNTRMEPGVETHVTLEACSSPQPQNMFNRIAECWYGICKDSYKVTESLPFEIFMKGFIRKFYNTLQDKTYSYLTSLLVNEEMTITHTAFAAFSTLCSFQQEGSDEDMLQHLCDSSCFLAISRSACETLLHSYMIQPGEALWLIRYSLARPGVLFLSWYTPNDKKEVFHNVIQWSKEENSKTCVFFSQIHGFSIHGTTLKELARNILAYHKLLAVQCPMTWLDRITASCRPKLSDLKDQERQRREMPNKQLQSNIETV